jgi:hypothetical protein
MEPEPVAKKKKPTEKNKGSVKRAGAEKTIPPAPSFIFNLLLASGLASLLVRNGWTAYPCVPIGINIVFVALVLTFFLQLFWRYLGRPIKTEGGAIRLPWLRLPLKAVFLIFDALHFVWLPNWGLWILTGTALAVALLALGPLSLFLSSEMPPVVNGFLVGPEGAEVFVSPGGTIEAQLGTALKITARIRASGEAHCTWFPGQGGFSAIHGCKVIYMAPLDGTVDNLSVQTQSACQTQNSFAGLNIQLISGQP